MVERFFVKNAKVHLNQGASYGLGGANHMRMNIGTSRKLVEQALDQHGERARGAPRRRWSNGNLTLPKGPVPRPSSLAR